MGLHKEKARELTSDIDRAITEISTPRSEVVRDEAVIKWESETDKSYRM